MNSSVCTLFEGHYHYGVGALVSSLHAQEFRGTVFAGYRGDLPPWARRAERVEGGYDFRVTSGLKIKFIRLETKMHLTNYKPSLMLEIFERHCPETESLFYFDPDITVNCRWYVFEDWVEAGVALCHNTGAWVPKSHPFRHSWRKFLAEEQIPCRRELDEYFNAGFVGVNKRDISFVQQWQRTIQLLSERGLIDTERLSAGKRSYAFNAVDQDALNITTMISDAEVSSMGEEAMGFAYGGSGSLMLHALGTPKPWSKCFLWSALQGRKPSRAEKLYWDFVDHPIALYSATEKFMKKADLFCGRLVGRIL